MAILFSAVLPFPPSLNGAYAGRKYRHKSKAYKSWLSRLEPLSIKQTINKPVSISYNLYLPNEVKRDISNYVKLIEDYLVSQGILEDDNYTIIQGVHIYYGGIDRKNPRVELVILPIE